MHHEFILWVRFCRSWWYSHNDRLLQYFIIPHEFMVYQNPINISWPHSYPSAILHTLWAYTVTQTVSISPNDIAVIYFLYSDPNPRSKRWGCSNRYCIVRHIVRHKLQLRLVSENVPKLLTGPHYTAISTLKWVKISWKPKKKKKREKKKKKKKTNITSSVYCYTSYVHILTKIVLIEIAKYMSEYHTDLHRVRFHTS